MSPWPETLKKKKNGSKRNGLSSQIDSTTPVTLFRKKKGWELKKLM